MAMWSSGDGATMSNEGVWCGHAGNPCVPHDNAHSLALAAASTEARYTVLDGIPGQRLGAGGRDALED